MSDTYSDRGVKCGASSLTIHNYYVPGLPKIIPYTAIESLRRVDTSFFRGQWRIWGTSNVHYWANLDAQRPKKTVGFILDAGKFVKPFVTPDEPDEFEAVIREHTGLPEGMGPSRAPFI